MNVAQTILAQLGGNRFARMTGANKFLGATDALSFHLPRGAKDKINFVKIKLTPMDVYDIEFSYYNVRKLKLEPVTNFAGAYAEDLETLFTSATGLYTRL